jgi:cation/acetate symporter
VARRSANNVGEERQVKVARLASLAVGVLAVLLGLLAQGLNVAVLVILAISIAASANFPIIVLSLFWRRFNTSGIILGMAAGVGSSVTLALLWPAVQGPEALFPIVNPVIMSMPIGFIGALLETLLVPRKPRDDAHFDEVLFRRRTSIRRHLERT